MLTWLTDLSVLDSQSPANVNAAQASSCSSSTTFDSRCHFTSLEAATSTPMVRIAEALRSGELEAARREIEYFTLEGTLSEFHQLNFYGLVEGIEASSRLAQIARRTSENDRSGFAALEREAAKHIEAAAAFLDGALCAAANDHERLVARENRASLALMRGEAVTAVTSLIAALRIGQTETLWANLLIALERSGATSDVDHVLDVLARSCPERLLRVITEDDQDLDNLRERPAYRRFLAKTSARFAHASC